MNYFCVYKKLIMWPTIAKGLFNQTFRASDIRTVAEPQNSGKSAKSPEIHKNTKNIMKFGWNLIRYMSVKHIWNLVLLLGLFTCVNFQIYLQTSSLKRANNIPQLPGVDCVAKNWALAMMLKALPLVHFWSVLLLKE